jgi:hypothetical protein
MPPTPEERARRALDHEAAGQICLASVATLASIIRAAVLDEREACARIAEGMCDQFLVGLTVAELIRARGRDGD